MPQSSGQPAAERASPSLRAHLGACGGPLRTKGTPAAMAGATLWSERLSGKLKGEMNMPGPRETRRTKQ